MLATGFVERVWSQREFQFPLSRGMRRRGYTIQGLHDHGIMHGEEAIHYVEGRIKVVCIEDGIRANRKRTRLRKIDLIRVAGSGVLDVAGTIRQLQERLQAPDAPAFGGVFSHRSCGAVALQKARTNSDEDPMLIGLRAAREVNAGLGGDPDSVEFLELLERPEELHLARVVYYDGTYSGADPSRHRYMPQGFVVSRGWMGPAIGKHDAELGAGIAFSSHGFASCFTEEWPFWFVGITDDDPRSVPAEQLQQELEGVVEDVWKTTLEGRRGERLRMGIEVIYAARQ